MAANDITEAEIDDLLELVETTPQRLVTVAASTDDFRLSQSTTPDEWSPLKILNHLRACEEVWMHSVHTMLAHDNPHLQEIHPRQWIKTPNPYESQSFAIGLQVFTLRRQAVMLMLRSLTPADWSREGRIAQKMHSVYSRVLQMANHESEHCDQIESMLNVSK